ncbi:hypothetical protein JAAARDRAFT_36469 [Jaapia argillacea MUCL 33604]|uniref:Secreted protein n=1 Tax=Jaapia argillacea MUCL 33604 TaxID=933084 RepID=A0A067PNC6_9AGAM|nr:hypothetical protein JAAARDRAFT_36469 [Jaapia argillacea MUCL 33604]
MSSLWRVLLLAALEADPTRPVFVGIGLPNDCFFPQGERQPTMQRGSWTPSLCTAPLSNMVGEPNEPVRPPLASNENG